MKPNDLIVISLTAGPDVIGEILEFSEVEGTKIIVLHKACAIGKSDMSPNALTQMRPLSTQNDFIPNNTIGVPISSMVVFYYPTPPAINMYTAAMQEYNASRSGLVLPRNSINIPGPGRSFIPKK